MQRNDRVVDREALVEGEVHVFRGCRTEGEGRSHEGYDQQQPGRWHMGEWKDGCAKSLHVLVVGIFATGSVVTTRGEDAGELSHGTHTLTVPYVINDTFQAG